MPGSLLLWCCGGTCVFFFFNDTATTEIYTLSLHDALPIYLQKIYARRFAPEREFRNRMWRSEEHTSELQSLRHLVCRLLIEKKNTALLAALRILFRRIGPSRTSSTH